MDTGVEDTGILDSLLNTDDYHIQMMLRQMENDEFLQALAGTSKEIRIRLLQNLSDRLVLLLKLCKMCRGMLTISAKRKEKCLT